MSHLADGAAPGDLGVHSQAEHRLEGRPSCFIEI